ncbi:hypothetical protein Tdes44962_MAKER04679 [Teratosphaeria destructans]|uniref:Uncharacterized protein n=1 Tax=Teratosphaeria destructans TaxID=418781 RepID=A0A9W7SLP9_9PEZI|nr:hypothetical protein Tdes44962_MAKER04679 [Teratosphaeria destructans]
MSTAYLLPFRKPRHIPPAQALDILDDQFERAEVESGDGVEGDVEKDQRPLEEGIDCVGCGCMSTGSCMQQE